MKIYNSFGKDFVEVVPNKDGMVGIYACGPTVYDFTHIGHGRKYVNDDVLRRALNYLGLKTRFVMNITDVGHLVSDGDEGEDKLEKGAAKVGKTVWEVAKEYTDYFHTVMGQLGVMPPDVECKATDHINDQIEMVDKLIEKGFAYETDEAVYFEVGKFSKYGELFGQSMEEKLVAVREEVNQDGQKRGVADFALWFKRVGRFANHVMYWTSPWGDGFPGWHIECSAMSMKYLGEQFAIHTGGEDHKSVHHPNEVAQSEAYSGKTPFVNIWMHHAFLKVDGTKMSKSLGNYLRVEDIVAKGFEALALRYMYLTAHYRKPMNFTFDSLESASVSLHKLRNSMHAKRGGVVTEVNCFRDEFASALGDDLNMPRAMAVVWEVAKSDLVDELRRKLLNEFDTVLGLNLAIEQVLPDDILELVEKRKGARKDRDFVLSDRLRQEIEAKGYLVKDQGQEMTVEKR